MSTVVHREPLSASFTDDLPPTSDDCTILRDGRRLDSADKVRAFVAEFRAEQIDKLSSGC